MTNTLTVNLSGIDLSNNEGAALLNDLVVSDNTYDLSIGTNVATLAGTRKIDSVSYENLDRNHDDRYDKLKPPGKSDRMKPRKGVDDQVAFDLKRMSETWTSKSDGLKVPLPFTSVFHELAEAYEKIENNKQYAEAHKEADRREQRLRNQRPYLKAYISGSGDDGDIHIKVK